MRNHLIPWLSLCLLIGPGCAGMPATLGSDSSSALQLDQPQTFEVGPSLERPLVLPFQRMSGEGSGRLMCKAFLPAEREINLALSGGGAPADCTSTRRSGVQDLMCDLRGSGEYRLQLSPTREGEQVRLQLLCFRVPLTASDALAASAAECSGRSAGSGAAGSGAVVASLGRPRVDKPRPERPRTDKSKLDSARADSSRPTPEPLAKPGPEKSGPAKSGFDRSPAERTLTENARPAASASDASPGGHAESGKPESGKPESSKPEPGAEAATLLRHISEVRGDPPSELTLDCRSALREGESGSIAVQDGKRWVRGRYQVIDAGSCEIAIKDIASPQTVLVRGHAVRMQGNP